MFLRRLHFALAGLLALSIILSAACSDDSADAVEISTATTAADGQARPTDTTASDTDDNDPQESAVADDTELVEDPRATTTPTNQAGGSLPGLDGYIDNRSGPVEVLQSLYSAVNLKQYARAYSYWEQSGDLAPFPDFVDGYASTATVDLTTGDVSTGAGAGQLYFDVPVLLHVTTTDGGSQIFAGCYVLHLARPEIQAEPPYNPMAIASADISVVETDADGAAIVAAGCQ